MTRLATAVLVIGWAVAPSRMQYWIDRGRQVGPEHIRVDPLREAAPHSPQATQVGPTSNIGRGATRLWL